MCACARFEYMCDQLTRTTCALPSAVSVQRHRALQVLAPLFERTNSGRAVQCAVFHRPTKQASVCPDLGGTANLEQHAGCPVLHLTCKQQLHVVPLLPPLSRGVNVIGRGH